MHFPRVPLLTVYTTIHADLRREVTVDEIIPSAIDAFATAFGADLRPLEELSRKLDQDIDPFLHNA